jgi:hypothetical protein
MSCAAQENFRVACRAGQLDDAKRMYELHAGEIDMHDSNDVVFREACMNGRECVVQWLCTQTAFAIHTLCDGYVHACRGGYLALAHWMRSA